MPKVSRKTHTRDHTKRHGKHHKRSHRYVKIYAPYLPLVISIVASLLLSFWQPQTTSTLAYATEMSTGGLLSATNAQRTGSSRKALGLNSRLNSAAQAKANDMVARNYWSHNTPDGKEPWVFIQNAGYAYTKAGENLAYGFSTSSATVTGWMNSATHKANMLDSDFTEVGFGFAKSANFNGDGQETVVVAMYGKPQTLGASTAPAPATSTPAPTSTPSAPSPAPQTAKPKPKKKAPAKKKTTPLPVNTVQTVAQAAPISQDVTRVQTLTGGRAPWLVAAITTITGLALAVMLLHHSLKLRHLVDDLLHDTRKFILHHPLLDSTLLGITILGVTLLHTVGKIL